MIIRSVALLLCVFGWNAFIASQSQASAQQPDKRIELTVRTIAAQRDAAQGQAQLCTLDATDLQRTLQALDAEQDAEQDGGD